MEKLELKHLAPYLPYDLKIFIEKSGIATLESLHNNAINDQLWFSVKERHGVYGYNVWKPKPILRPLSDFNNSDADSEIFKIGKVYVSVKLNEVGEFPYWQFEILVKHHFDVFGLIDSGLAIDINTLNQSDNGK